eukprot:SAG31_NODE_45493_length_258_cov_1.283019_1_plen_46_part_01
MVPISASGDPLPGAVASGGRLCVDAACGRAILAAADAVSGEKETR